jgi:agmatinase
MGMPTPNEPTPSFDADGRASDDAGLFGLDVTASEAAIVVIPVPFDATTSYGHGAHRGPRAILAASHQVDLFDVELGRPYKAGIHMMAEDPEVVQSNLTARKMVLAVRNLPEGDPAAEPLLAQINAAGDAIDASLYAQVSDLLAQDKIVCVVGGDHSVPLGTLRAHAEKYPEMGILHIDAHADLRDAYEGFVHSHASIMHNVLARTQVQKLTQVGLRDVGQKECRTIAQSDGRIVAFYERDLAHAALSGEPFLQVAARIVATLPHEVYISLDIDGLDPAFCPHTGTPVPGGLSFRETCALLNEVVQSGRRIVGFDLMEVAPGDDGSTWDANVGARLLYKLCGYTLASQGHPVTAGKNAPRARVGF